MIFLIFLFLLKALNKSVKPHCKLSLHHIIDPMSHALKTMKLDVASRTADRFNEFQGHYGIYRCIVKSLPNLYGTRRENYPLPIGADI